MNAKKVLCFGFLLLLCSFGLKESPPAEAQETQVTTISGVVVDANNSRVVDTLIKIENAKTRRQVRSDDEGRFRIEVPSGEYQITAEHRGFKRFEFSPFRANPSVCELVNIHLEVEAPKSTQKIN